MRIVSRSLQFYLLIHLIDLDILPAMKNTQLPLRLLIFTAGVFALLPIILLPHDMWDGSNVYRAFATENMDFLKTWFFSSRWTLQYYLYLFVGFLQGATGISYKIFTNVLSGAAIIGICVEIRRLLVEKVRLASEFSLFAVLVALVFPPWATLASSVLTFHICCVWAFLLAVRFLKINKLLALLLFVFSLSLHSVFAFAVGYHLFDGILTATKDNYKKKLIQIIVVGFVLLAIFASYRLCFPPYGTFENYNSINPSYFGFSLYCGFAAVILAFGYWGLAKKEFPEGRMLIMRQLLACLVLLFFACFAYWAVGKGIKVQGTNSFTPRHAYLSIVPIAMIFGVVAQYGVQRVGRKITYSLLAVFVLISFGYQFAAYQQKYVHAVYEDILIASLRKMPPPQPGMVLISSSRQAIPKYIRDFSGTTNWAFLAAYGKEVWLSKACTDGKNCNISTSNRKQLRSFFQQKDNVDTEDLKLTKLRFTLDGYDAFGSPLYYYYYFTKAYDGFHPQLDVVFVEPLDLEKTSY